MPIHHVENVVFQECKVGERKKLRNDGNWKHLLFSVDGHLQSYDIDDGADCGKHRQVQK